MSDWQPIETAPRDGTWFMICRKGEGYSSYEIGRYSPLHVPKYISVGGGLFKAENEIVYEWPGFNNFHRATHWAPVLDPLEAT